MSEFFDYDPVTGIRTDADYHEDGSVTLHRYADISAVVDYARRQAIEGVRDRGIKESWWHYAYIPPSVMVEMHNKGIDTTRDQKAVFQYINKHYPALKTTEKHHE